jgi:ABC-type multidrug transport system ATPase subunit
MYKDSNDSAYEMPEIQFFVNNVYLISGGNGAGKTTLMQHIHSKFLDESVLLDQSYENLLYLYKPAWWNIRIPKIINGEAATISKKEASNSMLKFGIADCMNKPVRVLSGGEKHMLLLLRIENTRHKVVLLDEPSTGLDSKRHNSLWDIIFTLATNNRTVIVISHEIISNLNKELSYSFTGCNNQPILINRLYRNQS